MAVKLACSQICMINSLVQGEHLEENQGIQRQFSTIKPVQREDVEIFGIAPCIRWGSSSDQV